MKTLKLFTLAIFILSTMVAYSNPVTKNAAKAQKEVLKDFRKVMGKYYATQSMDANTTTSFLIYYTVNNDNYVEVQKMIGPNTKVEQDIKEILKKKPIEGASILKGNTYKFRLKLIKEAY